MLYKKYFKEIIYRINFLCFSFLLNAACLYFYREEIFYCVGSMQNQEKAYFICTNIAEVFNITIYFIANLSIYLSTLYTIYQLYALLNPALYKRESKIFTTYLIISVLVYLLLSYLTPKYALKAIWEFFVSFEYVSDDSLITIENQPRLKDSIELITKLILNINLAFNLSIFLILAISSTNKNLSLYYRKVFYFGFLLTATLLTPPDVITLLLVYAFQIVLCETFFFLMYLQKHFELRSFLKKRATALYQNKVK